MGVLSLHRALADTQVAERAPRFLHMLFHPTWQTISLCLLVFASHVEVVLLSVRFGVVMVSIASFVLAAAVILQILLYCIRGEDEKSLVDVKVLCILHVTFWLLLPLTVWFTLRLYHVHVSPLEAAALASSSLLGGVLAILIGPLLYVCAIIALIYCIVLTALSNGIMYIYVIGVAMLCAVNFSLFCLTPNHISTLIKNSCTRCLSRVSDYSLVSTTVSSPTTPRRIPLEIMDGMEEDIVQKIDLVV